MDFTEKFRKFKNRIIDMGDALSEMTEEATKNALVMPFFSMLGYDVFNPREFVPEYTCDVGTKKGEKIDYAILRDGDPIILIEAKRCGMKLQKQQQGQLYRYFSVNRSRIAILTNGLQYNIYSDINAPNVMDDEPFLSFNIVDDDESVFIKSLERFTSENFDVKDILSKAVYLKYAAIVERTFIKDLESPSDELVKYFLSRPEIKTGGRITSNIINQYRDVTAQTLRKVMGITITDIPDVSVPEKSDIPQVCEAVASALSDISGIGTYSYGRLSGVHQLSYGNLFRICIPDKKLGRYVVWFANPSRIKFITGIDELKAYLSSIL